MTASTPAIASSFDHFVRPRTNTPPVRVGLQGRRNLAYPLYALRQPRRSAEKVEIERLRTALSNPAFVARILDAAFPAQSQYRQCAMTAGFLGIHPETVRRWITGATSPRFSDFWPVILRAYGRHDPEAARSLSDFLRKAG